MVARFDEIDEVLPGLTDSMTGCPEQGVRV